MRRAASAAPDPSGPARPDGPPVARRGRVHPRVVATNCEQGSITATLAGRRACQHPVEPGERDPARSARRSGRGWFVHLPGNTWYVGQEAVTVDGPWRVLKFPAPHPPGPASPSPPPPSPVIAAAGRARSRPAARCWPARWSRGTPRSSGEGHRRRRAADPALRRLRCPIRHPPGPMWPRPAGAANPRVPSSPPAPPRSTAYVVQQPSARCQGKKAADRCRARCQLCRGASALVRRAARRRGRERVCAIGLAGPGSTFVRVGR